MPLLSLESDRLDILGDDDDDMARELGMAPITVISFTAPLYFNAQGYLRGQWNALRGPVPFCLCLFRLC